MTKEQESAEVVRLTAALKQAERLQQLSFSILRMLNEDLDIDETLTESVAAIKRAIGFDAVGIRLQRGADFPYFRHDGFTADFLRTEDTLLAKGNAGGTCREECGGPQLECTCGLVLLGRTDPANPLFTPYGSCWLNQGWKSPGFPGEHNDPRINPRNRCLHDGFNSIALIPIRAERQILGLMQLNDRQPNRLTLGMTQFFEGLAAGMGIALMRKQAEEALRKSEVKYRNLFNNAGVGMFRTRLDGSEFLESNDKYLAILGRTREETIGKPSATHWVDPEARKGMVETLTATGHVDELECRLIRRDGAIIDCVTSLRLYPEQSMLEGSILDITARKQAENAVREQHAELERFTYAVSHDLKSPLVTIKTFLAYLESDLKNNNELGVSKDLEFLCNAAEKMSQLLDELTRLSRVGRIKNPTEEVLLQTVVREALALVAGRFTQRGIAVKVTDEPVLLCGDRRRLVEMFQNLFDNAAKFTGDQSFPQVEVGVESRDEELRIFVRDNGIGFQAEHKEKIFGIFQRFDANSEGSGIGLALIRRIVQLHGGRIWAESNGPGTGATFKFTLASAKRA